MDGKHNRMIEGSLYFFSLPRGKDKASVSEAIKGALTASKSGRLLGSGTSLVDHDALVIEIGTHDRYLADDAISHACEELKCRDFEVVWD